MADACENVATGSGSQGQSKDCAQWNCQSGYTGNGGLVVGKILHLCAEVKAVVLVKERCDARVVSIQGVGGDGEAAGDVPERLKVDS